MHSATRITSLTTEPPRPTNGDKIDPEQVATLGILDIEALIEQLNSPGIYSGNEAHAIKLELLKITTDDLARKAEALSPFPEMLVRKTDKEIDNIWKNLRKPRLPAPPLPGL